MAYLTGGVNGQRSWVDSRWGHPTALGRGLGCQQYACRERGAPGRRLRHGGEGGEDRAVRAPLLRLLQGRQGLRDGTARQRWQLRAGPRVPGETLREAAAQQGGRDDHAAPPAKPGAATNAAAAWTAAAATPAAAAAPGASEHGLHFSAGLSALRPWQQAHRTSCTIQACPPTYLPPRGTILRAEMSEMTEMTEIYRTIRLHSNTPHDVQWQAVCVGRSRCRPSPLRASRSAAASARPTAA